MTTPTIREAWPAWATSAADVERLWEDADPFRHVPLEPEALWPEIVDDRCCICGGVVEDGLVECSECFEVGDAAYERRLDV